MGNYLAHPVRTKETEHGLAGPFHWASSSMQGWRLRMEDAHVTGTPLSLAGAQPSLFAVFDGHGGREVAKYSALHIAQTLERLTTDSVPNALVATFHALDDQMRDPENSEAITHWREADEESTSGRGAVSVLKSSIQADLASAKDRGNLTREEARAVMMKMMLLKRLEDQREGVAEGAAEAAGASAVADGAVEADESKTLQATAPQVSVKQKSQSCADRVGCTAVACVLYPPPNARVVVANAGDSRCILSRRGKAVELSFDHKPNSDIERARIEAAGGWVEAIDNPIRTHHRVNGNLNLSRSLGDLEYKQRKDLGPEKQVICATPDIVQETITPEDEFIVLACDGIWDILSSQECVDFVRQRLAEESDLEKVVECVLDRCISEDPKTTQGLGADNMTCIVVLLKSAKDIFAL